MAKHRAQDKVSKAQTNYSTVSAPKCPHGHYVRWAVKNCKGCQ